MRLSFGPFAFDPQSRLLWRDGTEIALPPRVLGVLEVLLERAGEVVARQDLLDRVWKDAFVTDTSLAEAVSFLRSALGDDPQSPRYIQTVHRRGYRFLVVPTTTDPASNQGQTRVRPGSDAGSTRVKPGFDEGQTGVRPGSDHLRRTFAPPRGTDATDVLTDRDRTATHPERTADWRLVPWSIALLCAGLAAAAVWHTISAPPPAEPATARFEVRTAPGTVFDRDPQPIAIAPDGRSLAWSACETTTGRCAIYLRPIDRLEAEPLEDTDGGHSPVFSPDGRWIAFFADGSLRKIAAAGGASSMLANAPDPGGATWGPDGRIVFAASAASGLSLIDGQGGDVQTLTTPRVERGELRHRHPAWLTAPNGRAGGVLFTVTSTPGPVGSDELAAMPRDTNGITILRSGVSRATPAAPGYLLLAAGPDLQAATFDDRALVLTGVTDSVPAPRSDGVPRFAVGANALAVIRAPARAERVWSDGASGASLARFASIVVSPDSRRAAAVDDRDIWIADLASGATARLTFSGVNVSPAWSTDGTRLIFATREASGPFHVVSRQVSDRNEPATPVVAAPPHAFPTSIAADGRVALTQYKDGHTTIAILTPAGALRPLTDGPFDEGAAVFSPDGRWLALESTASSRTEVILRSTADGRRIPVSNGGGRHPQWSDDGRSIYFESGRRVMRAPFALEGGPAAGRADGVLDRNGEHAVAIAPSGRILIDRQADADSAVVVLQWLRELRERLPLPVNVPR